MASKAARASRHTLGQYRTPQTVQHTESHILGQYRTLRSAASLLGYVSTGRGIIQIGHSSYQTWRSRGSLIR
eukprot:3940561-Rhodomonas_salina.1